MWMEGGLLRGSKNFSLGIMQGRLTPSLGRGIQFFPFENWEKEFHIGSGIGLSEIEFIFDFDRFQENPLYSKNGQQRVASLIRETGVKVFHICADFFMQQPFFNPQENKPENNPQILNRLIDAAEAIGSIGIEIPLVDNSSIKTDEQEDMFIEYIYPCLDYAKAAHVTIGLEIDYPPDRFKALLKKFDHPAIRANYDSGNSAGLGYEPYEEIMAIKEFLSNVHIKDRLVGGKTVPLGTGSTQFRQLFAGLCDSGYTGSFILQACRGPDGHEADTIKKQIAFVENCINSSYR